MRRVSKPVDNRTFICGRQNAAPTGKTAYVGAASCRPLIHRNTMFLKHAEFSQRHIPTVLYTEEFHYLFVGHEAQELIPFCYNGIYQVLLLFM